MTSTRFVPGICVLLAIALVPTLIHSYSDAEASDGRSVAAIPTTLADRRSVPSDRNPTWGRRRFETDEWIERVYSGARVSDELKLTVVRSFDAKTVYHHPELAIAYGTSFVGEDTQHLPGRPEIPLHVLKPDVGTRAGAVYALHYDDRFIDDPIAFQIRTAAELLFSPRKPVTLFFVLDTRANPSNSIDKWSAVSLLVSAIDGFLKQ